MVSKASRTHSKKTVSGILLAAVVSVGFVVLPAAPAIADGCSSGQINFGCSVSAAPPPAGGSSTSSGPAAPPATGGGGGTIVPATQTVDRRVPDAAANCPVRDDGKASLGADYIFDTQWASNNDGPSSPPNGDPSWLYQYSTPNGEYFFKRTVFLHRDCLYPPRTYMTTAQCIISSSASVSLVNTAPGNGATPGIITQATSMSGYPQGSMDYSACVNSSSRVDPHASLTVYGYYTATAVSQAQTAMVEVAYTPNDVTGIVPAPKIVSLSGVYNLTPVSTSGSLECSGFYTPGNKNADFTETPCSGQNIPNGASYTCVQDQPLFDSTVGAGSENLIPFPTTNSIQGLKDGNPKHIVFSQKPTGASITVNSYDTFYTRDASSTPWKSGAGPQDNVFTLNTAKTGINGHSIFTNFNGTRSPFISGQADDVWATSIEAGSSSAPTLLTQVQQWSGTKTMNSVEITSIDVLSGKFTYTTKQIQVPTTGECKQTVAINYVRTIGDYLP